MDLHLLHSSAAFSAVRFFPRQPSPTYLGRRFFTVRSSLPFPNEKAKYHKELEAAVAVVERACSLCVEVQRSLFSDEGRIVEKSDQTPVTVADFGVQALVSLELGKLFPSIPLVAEEDSGFLRENNLVEPVVSVVSDKTSFDEESLSQADVLKAIDRGGKNAFAFGIEPATYWILDPIDGTRGFVQGRQALYVVGLCLVVEGEIVAGVMGCPNWAVDTSNKSTTDAQGYKNSSSESGIIMVAHIGCGTWTKRLNDMFDSSKTISADWTRCLVDSCCLVNKARFCIPESQTWESIPFSVLYEARIDDDDIGDKEIRLLPTCCGSLCKYLMVASGRASIFIQRTRSQKVIRAWDHAVGVICVHEAGGKVTDWKGSEIDLAADQAERRTIYPEAGILVSNGNLHNQILEMVSSNSTVI
ncbi:Inositol monophosphatase [Corchorus olitorius]|uniref:Inositol monophosphatase n=1 Tax=Corchorus olitorius TaxID=93759 RepID=A0A1R3H3Y1_9ROSI|nr:Inositol monophosphatase [Corchorus olitorius]